MTTLVNNLKIENGDGKRRVMMIVTTSMNLNSNLHFSLNALAEAQVVLL